jgi:hypothetical protein
LIAHVLDTRSKQVEEDDEKGDEKEEQREEQKS